MYLGHDSPKYIGRATDPKLWKKKFVWESVFSCADSSHIVTANAI